jgi:putative ABC transport system permease protein
MCVISMLDASRHLAILAARSLWNRRGTALLTALSIALAMLLLAGVERLREQAREGFSATISGVDLIAGARASPLQLLLYSVFHLGDATNNLSWSSYQRIAALPRVAWAVPVALGDSHRGHRVVGTTAGYFEHVRHGRQTLRFAQGAPFTGLHDAVLGHEVARTLGYGLGQRIVLAHGTGVIEEQLHDDQPFTVSGILAPTGTPVDRAVLVSLEAIEAIHRGWESGVRLPRQSATTALTDDFTPRSITALMLGLKSRAAVFHMQRAINEHEEEALTAILPGAALQSLWDLTAAAEGSLLLISALVALTAISGMVAALLTNLAGRRREMAILRAAGARPAHILALVLAEALLLTAAGVVLGYAMLHLAAALLSPVLEAHLGLHINLHTPVAREAGWLLGLWLAALVSAVPPAWLAYRHSITDGLSMRL